MVRRYQQILNDNQIENASLIQEVVDVAFRPSIFRDSVDMCGAHFQNALLIKELDYILLYRNCRVQNARIKQYVWNDDIKHWDNELFFSLPRKSDSYRNKCNEAAKEFEHDLMQHLQNQLTTNLPVSEIPLIVEDFYMFFKFRALVGTEATFHEHLLDVYKRGGYPCGWDGEYPNGRLVVYTLP